METFGRYQLIRKLAAGGMGAVYLARQKGPVGFEKLLVVKRILPHLAQEEQFIEMFFDEARIAANLNHPNIAQIYDLGEVDGQYYIAMEYVHGESLRQLNLRSRARKKALPAGLVCRIVAETAAGLHSAHNAKNPQGKPLALIHRDVSPQNILVGFNGTVKLIDFGVAKAANKASNTATGAIKGKYAYMSPEQARGEELDHRSDIFGLGVILYEQLTQTRLFKRETDALTLRAVVSAKVPPASSVNATIPAAIDPIVGKALERDRDQRYPHAAALQLALEEFIVRQQFAATSPHLADFMKGLYAPEKDEDATQVEGE